jgi:4-hydroxybenzoate polyprenyltransferase
VAYLALIRPKDWAKNLFLFVPLFFSGRLFEWELYPLLIIGTIAFCFAASSIYIINDYRDIDEDKKHPVKFRRPLASGAVSRGSAVILCALLFAGALAAGYAISYKFLFIVALYLALNLAYSFGLKTIPILDIIIVATGFVLRIKGGAVIAKVGLSEWLTIMVFLLALFMAIGKRRDDVLLKLSSGTDMRKSVKGYNIEYLNVVLGLVCAVIVVAYLMYTMSPEVVNRMGTHRLFYTCLPVLAGIMRYLQIIFVQAASGSPTGILYRDRFIQAALLLWIAGFYLIIYMKDVTLFK